jgi:protein-tyrosine phosphatase
MTPMFTMRSGRPSASVVTPSLVVGGYPDVADLAWLADEYGVGAVVCLQDDFDLAAKRLSLPALQAECQRLGLVHHRLPVADGDDEVMARRLPQIVALLGELIGAGQRVYLHCNAGMNRAPTAAIAYLHVADGHDLGRATRLVKAQRPCVPLAAALDAAYGRGARLRPRRP